MKKIFFTLLFLLSLNSFSQEENEIKEVVLTVNDSLQEKELDNVPLAIVEDFPVFPGCEKKNKEKKLKCFLNEMNKHLIKNFTYPTEASEDNIQGRVEVSFIINIEGIVVDVETSGANQILQDEVRRIVSLLPKLKPGKQNGIPVNVIYTMPIIFKIQ